MFQKEGHDDCDGYVEGETPSISRTNENFETDEDDSIDGSKRDNACFSCSDANEREDGICDGEDEDGRKFMWVLCNCPNLRNLQSNQVVCFSPGNTLLLLNKVDMLHLLCCVCI